MVLNGAANTHGNATPNQTGDQTDPGNLQPEAVGPSWRPLVIIIHYYPSVSFFFTIPVNCEEIMK